MQTRPREPIPHSVAVILEGKREGKRLAYESLTPEERAEADAWQQAYREEQRRNAVERRAKRRDRDGFILRSYSQGESTEEIAFALNIPVRTVAWVLLQHGISRGRDPAARYRLVRIRTLSDVALHRLISDMSIERKTALTVDFVLELVCEAVLCEDAYHARKLLRVTRKGATP